MSAGPLLARAGSDAAASALPGATTLDRIVRLAEDAGRAILDVYSREFEVEWKDDASPLTAADLAAHTLIVAGLAQISPGVPILSEEASEIPWLERSQWRSFWLVDPLDGTREFVKRNGEFTVNIALIEGHRPVLGVVHAPALGRTAWAQRGAGAFQRDGVAGVVQPMRVAPRSEPPWRVLGSRSHRDSETARFLDAHGPTEVTPLGSSLKFVEIAAGAGDVYVRLGPTSEWDTAAGQCVLECAGGTVVDLEGRSLTCNLRDTLINPSFLACAGEPSQWIRSA